VGTIGHRNKGFIFATAASLSLLMGCGSTPKPVAKTPVVTPQKPVDVQTNQPVTPEHKLLEAKKVWQGQKDKDARDSLLLDAAALYIQQEDTLLAQQVLIELRQDGIAPSLHDRYALLLAKAYINNRSADPAKLHHLLEGLNTSTSKKAEIQTTLFAKQGMWADAANALLRTNASAEVKVEQVWTWIKQLDETALQKADRQFPALRPFISLRDLTHEYAQSSVSLQEGLKAFQRTYPGHMLAAHLPKDVMQAQALSQPDLQEIAVFLPLSGRLASTGEAVKDGIMAAYYEQLTIQGENSNLPALRFIDTLGKSPQALVSELGEAKFIVGPLLKETVESLIPVLPANVNMLALNRVEPSLAPSTQPQLSPSDVSVNSSAQDAPLHQEVRYFGLAPEDEAEQLANFIFNKGLRAPIVVAAQSSLYERMHDAFKDRWFALHKQKGTRAHVTTVTFNDSSSLREGITQALDVAQSNKRINQIEYMVNEDVYNMPRSRRDIDAIIAFASPQDTELLNPIIEASLNPYDGKQVPVYATSRSMDYDSGKNQWRDLQNVRFIDMPWMMPTHQWQALAATTDTVWPNRTTMQNRLFAFGFDAYNLLPQLGMLTVLPYLKYEGLTGELQINDSGEVKRQLPQAVINNERVQMLME